MWRFREKGERSATVKSKRRVGRATLRSLASEPAVGWHSKTPRQASGVPVSLTSADLCPEPHFWLLRIRFEEGFGCVSNRPMLLESDPLSFLPQKRRPVRRSGRRKYPGSSRRHKALPSLYWQMKITVALVSFCRQPAYCVSTISVLRMTCCICAHVDRQVAKPQDTDRAQCKSAESLQLFSRFGRLLKRHEA